MSAKEIIEQIKAPPRDERKVVDQYVISNTSSESTTTGLQEDEFENLVDRVFDKHAALLQRLAQ